ncbi:Protein N-acetyltransferase, RimJ/RimL family [Marinactinospora thermotolerans DSM 45154]|uniref:Protein N-acetyltransferase, RimJ/RimL family n=1 Tax=Marinactinospora thermotolerans DSM 45154 TaxID=1122192 RepID=A0A1T4SE40_9ACTN|nr:GNAT family protein [Marinactinospora thermotolerans]SKA26131.1 Protein N-acetyltransferase, RimJ/RimL family [Marinactinospora thermotolerans DSM 45154]
MADRFWPLYDLRITTPRLELRLPDLELLTALASLAAEGVHEESAMPFTVPWTAGSPEERGRSVIQHNLGLIGQWRPESWALGLAVLHRGTVVGLQDLFATDFAVTREVETGSWLGLAHQGQGIGTEMRAAVLALAFEGLDAHWAVSGAMTDNRRSLGVSRRLGYRPDGHSVVAVQGRARTVQRLRLDRAAWQAHRTVSVEIGGLEPCLPLFGC